jgi:hypothetical protein
MTKKITIFATALMFITMISEAQTIPNAGFETWDNMGTYSNPNGWATMNNTTTLASVYTAEMGTPGSPGSSYLKLTSKTTPLGVANGIAVSGKLDSTTQMPVSGFAYNMRPTSFDGKWQHMIFGSSQGSITVSFSKWNTTTMMRDVIGTGSKTLAGMAMSWANFSIPITFTSGAYPDSCIIVMQASGTAPTNQDYLWVDNLSFVGAFPAGVNDVKEVTNSIYPNPVTDKLNIKNDMNANEICVFDLSGKMVLCSKEDNISSINVSKLPNVNYSFKLFKNNEQVATSKFIKQ